MLETHALEEIDLEIRPGDYVAVAGPSGCGKSRLLSLLGLLDTPTSGQYWLNDQRVEGLSLKERARTRHPHHPPLRRPHRRGRRPRARRGETLICS